MDPLTSSASVARPLKGRGDLVIWPQEKKVHQSDLKIVYRIVFLFPPLLVAFSAFFDETFAVVGSNFGLH